MTPARRFHRAAVWLHRWTGLVIALFLVVCGATGSVLAFGEEIDGIVNPAFHRVTPPAQRGTMLDPLAVRERVLAAYPGTTIDWVPLDTKVDRPMVFGLAAAPGATAELSNDEVFVDPYNGRILGQRRNGDLTQGVTNLVPFIDRLHTSLALGSVGSTVLGIAALLWTIDCFVGFYLTLPAPRDRRKSAPRDVRSWLHRWRYAWRLRWGTNAAKLNFDWHRASGLWLWVLLFIFAWSSVGFNLRSVYDPTMHALFGHEAAAPPTNPPTTPLLAPPIGFAAARSRARELMAEVAHRRGFTVRHERLIHYDAERGVYGYRTLSTLDVGDKLGNTNIAFDAGDGRLVQTDLPTRQDAGDTVTTWIGALHTASVGGVAWQIAVCMIGIAVVALSGTGVVIWWQRRRARRGSRTRTRARPTRSGATSPWSAATGESTTRAIQ